MKPLLLFALAFMSAAGTQAFEAPDHEALRAAQRERDGVREAEARERLAVALAKLQRVRGDARDDNRRLADLEKQIDELDTRAQRQRDTLVARQAQVRELYTTARQAAGDLALTLRALATAPPSPGMDAGLRDLAASPRALSLDDLGTLWESLHEVLTYSATQSRHEAPVQTALAELQTHTVTRLGTIAAISASRHARFDPVAGVYRLQHAETAAAARLLARVDNSDNVMLEIPLRLADVVAPAAPPLWRASGPIGVLIATLGVIGTLLLALRAWVVLGMRRADRLGRLDSPSARLGRAREIYGGERSESLAGWINAAVRREVRRLYFGHAALQVIIAAAPLLGLLGTVTGMIVMFEQLRIYGSGDPVLMAGGISQALSTTWLGLVVALPLLLGHRLVVALASELVQRLDQQAVAFVASARTAA